MIGTFVASATARGEHRVEAVAGAVAVHRGEQDLAGTERLAPRTAHSIGVDPSGFAAALDVDLEAFGLLGVPGGRRRASIASTTHWLPNSSAISEISSGRASPRPS